MQGNFLMEQVSFEAQSMCLCVVHAGGDDGWVERLNTGTAVFKSPNRTKSTVRVPKVGLAASRAPPSGPPARLDLPLICG